MNDLLTRLADIEQRLRRLEDAGPVSGDAAAAERIEQASAVERQVGEDDVAALLAAGWRWTHDRPWQAPGMNGQLRYTTEEAVELLAEDREARSA